MTDTNMEEASARLKALQTQQQLAVQSLSIANGAPQSIMTLFR
jgi:flagellin